MSPSERAAEQAAIREARRNQSAQDMAGRGVRPGPAAAQLGSVILAIAELHRKDDSGSCEECSSPYPCRTIEAVAGEVQRGNRD